MLAAAQNVAVLNGVARAAVTANLVTSPVTATDQAVQATIRTDDPIVFGQVLGFDGSLAIQSTSYAQIPSPPSGGCLCILALNSSGAGITMSGGTSIDAPNCVVASQASYNLSGSGTLTADYVYYDASPPTLSGGAKIVATIEKASTSDPLAGNAGVIAANARAVANETLAAPTIPSIPSIPTMPAAPGGANITFGYYPTTMTAGPCSGTLSGSTWNMSCTGAPTLGSSVASGMTCSSGAFVTITASTQFTSIFGSKSVIPSQTFTTTSVVQAQ